MRIDPHIPASQNSETSRANEVQSPGPKATSATSAGQPSDTVELSSGQATIRQLVSQLDHVPDVRQEQVNALRLEVQTGQYQRSSEQVAGAIVTQLLGIQ
jgi:flagellar biosynthesis anti-sigma factor FlgM